MSVATFHCVPCRNAMLHNLQELKINYHIAKLYATFNTAKKIREHYANPRGARVVCGPLEWFGTTALIVLYFLGW